MHCAGWHAKPKVMAKKKFDGAGSAWRLSEMYRAENPPQPARKVIEPPSPLVFFRILELSMPTYLVVGFLLSATIFWFSQFRTFQLEQSFLDVRRTMQSQIENRMLLDKVIRQYEINQRHIEELSEQIRLLEQSQDNLRKTVSQVGTDTMLWKSKFYR